MSEIPQDAGGGVEGAIGDLELEAEQAEGVKGGAEPTGKPGKSEPPIKGVDPING